MTMDNEGNMCRVTIVAAATCVWRVIDKDNGVIEFIMICVDDVLVSGPRWLVEMIMGTVEQTWTCKMMGGGVLDRENPKCEKMGSIDQLTWFGN